MAIADSLSDMFVLHLPVLEKAVRPIIVYGFLLAAFRLAGKRELLQFTTFDFVLLLLLSNTVQNAIIGDDNSVTGGLIGAAVLLGSNALLARLLYAVPAVNHVVVGDPTTIVENGRPVPTALRQLRISHAELISLIRRQNFSALREVEHAEVQPTGSVVMHGYHPTEDERTTQEIIERLGRIEAALAAMGAGTPPTPTRQPDTPAHAEGDTASS